MILPHTVLATLLLMVLTMFCWGTWTSSFKAARVWRFELYYFDFSIGVGLATVIAAFTFGTLGFDGFVFLDDLLHHAAKHSLFYGAAGGAVFNLANMLLLGAVSVTGLAVAFPITMGVGLVSWTVWSYFGGAKSNLVLLGAAVGAVILAVVVDVLAYRRRSLFQLQVRIEQGLTKSTKKRVAWKGIVLSILSGILMSCAYPLVQMGMDRDSDTALGPYGMAFMFAAGIFGSMLVFNLFFMNLPVEGSPLEFLEYFKGSVGQHLLGVGGGVIWAAGAVSYFVAQFSPQDAQLSPSIGPALAHGSAVVAALWGVLVWREFSGVGARVKILLSVMLLLFALGLALVAVAPTYVVQ